MSTANVERLRCPRCAHVYERIIYRGLHISRLPEVRAQILAGTWQRWPCPSCGAVLRVCHTPAIYTDFPRHTYIVVEGRGQARVDLAAHRRRFDQAFTFGPPAAEELGASLRPRVVLGLPALREKLILDELGLDDHVVEACKGDLQRAMGVDPAAEQLRVQTVFDGGHLLLVRLPPDADAVADGGLEFVDGLPTLGHVTLTAAAIAVRAAHRGRIASDWPRLATSWLVDIHHGHRVAVV